MVPLQIFYKRITILVFVTCLMIGCRSNRNVEIPDAPPPYANFPAPQNFQNPQPVAVQSHGNLFADSYNPAPPYSNYSNPGNSIIFSSFYKQVCSPCGSRSLGTDSRPQRS